MPVSVLEPVEVIVYFKNLELQILKFRRDSSVYKVSKMISKWKIKAGDNLHTHFVVQCDEQKVACELSYNHIDWKWEFVQFDNLD